MSAPTLRSSTVQQINDNIIEATLVPEFFGPVPYIHGETIPLPNSPVDGYVYARTELFYLWSYDTGSPSEIRLSVFAPSINWTTGVVTINTWRMPPGGPIILRHDGFLRVIVVGVRQSLIPIIPAPAEGPPADVANLAGDFGPYDISIFVPGIQTVASEVFAKVILPRKVNFQAGFGQSTVTPASTAATADTILSIQINAVEIATVIYLAGHTTGTFGTARGLGSAYFSFLSPESASTFNGTSDILSVVGPATPDPTLADFGVVLAAKRAF